MITVEAAMVKVRDAAQAGALGELSRFRQEFYRCLSARADALFELADAVLCADGPVKTLVGLSLVPGHRRGHGALYEGAVWDTAGRVGHGCTEPGLSRSEP
jgi:DDE superfamily endonuclease